ncbi:MAG: EF-hand domain-containing protein [Hyphomicrobium sp.]
MTISRLALFGAAALVSAAAFAAPVAAGPSAKHIIAALDPDKDGTLDKGEVLRGAIAKFKRMNPDKDRTLEPNEVVGVVSPRAFVYSDRNKDGKLSLGEYLHLTKLAFLASNPDKDRTIEADELRTKHGRVLARMIY